jgi:uncharacterized glyoxalase superfamily protein PhnB
MADAKYRFNGIVPSHHYEDGAAMIHWLTRVLGFEERARYVDRDGRVRQAELYVGDFEFWFNGHEPGYWEKLGHRPNSGVVVFVDDVDAHHARVRATGVDAPAPQDQSWGARSYFLRDPEGYWWSFVHRLPRGYVQVKTLEEGGLREIKAPTFRP